MNIALYLLDKIVNFRLPNDISGSFSFGAFEEDNKLINIEARNGKWVLYQTKEVGVIINNSYVSEVPLTPNTFYILRKEEKNYLIYVSEAKSANIIAYKYSTNLNLIIGNNDQSNIKYNCPYLNDVLIQVNIKNNQLILQKQGNGVIYSNKISIKQNPFVIKVGDEIEIYGLRIIFLNGMLLINSMNNLQIESSSNIEIYPLPMQEAPKEIEIKDIDLYKKEDYFSKSPRIRRVIETKNIKLSAPPRDGENQELPLILVIGPMLTMGATSGLMVLNTVSRISSGETTMEKSWIQLATSGIMLVSTLLWPLITQAYNRKAKVRKQKQIIKKYKKYLDEKRTELKQESSLQKNILLENLITVEECLNIIKQKNLNFWDKRLDQSDFLVVRIGMGDELLDAKIEYPDEEFTIEESEIKKEADNLVEEFKYIKDVPIGYSFYENKTTAIMGNRYKTVNFVNNIILQLLTFYSYEDLKIVVFTNEENKNDFSYIRYLNHSFDNAKDFRFFATNQDSIKNVSEYLNFEVNNRMNAPKNNNDNTPPKPYYFIIVDDYEKIKRYDFVKNITESDDNLGFSLVILENRLSKLPSKCNNFINLGEKTSGILKNSYEKQEQISFTDEIRYNIDMMTVAKTLANIPIEFEEGIKQLPNSITFLEMEKVGKVEQLNILNRWNTNDSTQSLRAEVGVDEQGDLMYLDLHEKYHGPHGLIAGMTGSGKSEFIITYILSMAINYSPDDVEFILIDYKGGGLAFAFENKATGVSLPHLAGTITNLDKAEMDRTLVSIDSEIKRRQKVFNDARDKLGESTIDIYKYQKYYKEGKLEEAVPHLFIICDEFAELKSQQPDFMDNLISVARIGRSLGVHLILATQKPSGVVNDQIWSNTKFRVCLKVQDESDSREMLKRPEAASLKQTGRFYLQVGFDEYFALGQSAWCGAKYYPSETIVKQVDKSVNFIDDCGNFIKSIQAGNNIKIEAKGEQLASIMNSIIEVSNMVNKKAKRLWLENISGTILVEALERKYNYSKQLYNVDALLGEYDAPEKQEQGLVKYNFLSNGNTIIYGIDGSERELLLNTIIYSSSKNHTAEELNYYIIDYGSESLTKWNSLPQVGGVVLAGEDEKYGNLFKMLREELQQRKKLFSEYGGEYLNYIKSNPNKLPIKVIIINNYDSVYEANPSIYDELPDLIRDSERYGIIFIISGNATNSVQNKIAQNCHNLYTFRLKDSSDYGSVFGVRTKVVPRDIFGRALLKMDTVHEFQTANIVTEPEKLNEQLQAFINSQKQINKTKAKRIPTLPDIIRFNDVKDAISTLRNVPVGISKKDLEICTIDYLSNSLGYIITSNKLVNTRNFIVSMLSLFKYIKNINIFVIDPLNQLLLNREYFPNYYIDNLTEVIDKISEYIEKLKSSKSKIEGIILIYGINKFITKLNDNTKFQNFTKLIKDYENISVIIVDDVSKIKGYTFETWYTNIFSNNDGLWIGKGLSDQNLLHLSSINKEMSKEIKNNMGYLINESSATLLKLIDFVTKDEEVDNNGK